MSTAYEKLSPADKATFKAMVNAEELAAARTEISKLPTAELKQACKQTLKPNPTLFKKIQSDLDGDEELTAAAHEHYTSLEFHLAHLPAAQLKALLKKTQGSACELELTIQVVYDAMDVMYAVNEELAMRENFAELNPSVSDMKAHLSTLMSMEDVAI